MILKQKQMLTQMCAVMCVFLRTACRLEHVLVEQFHKCVHANLNKYWHTKSSLTSRIIFSSKTFLWTQTSKAENIPLLTYKILNVH